MTTLHSYIPPAAVPHQEEVPSEDPGTLITQHAGTSPLASTSEPTESHALASQTLVDPNQAGASPPPSAPGEVLDLGWNEADKSSLPPIVQGLDNEQLWALLRRFNKQAFCVRRIHQPPLANLDMNIADDDGFAPEKLRAQLERGYVSVVVPLAAAANHLARLRSWNERRRTAAFLLAYACAWACDLLVPATVVFLMVLILVPAARRVAFPPAPISRIDSATGGLQTPPAGVAATDDTLTGAPEKVAGEAVEQEAHSFVNTLGSVALSTTIGGPASDDDDDVGTAPGADKLVQNVSEAKATAAEGDARTARNETRQPAAKMVWQRARPFMHAVTDLVDTWERFGNALSPTPPFPRSRARARLAAALLPVALAALFTTPYMLAKGSGLVLGLVLFGAPLLNRLTEVLERTYPRWQRFVELRHSVLRGVPTNAQLAVTLLRIGEKNKAPIPAPPDPDAVFGTHSPHLKRARPVGQGTSDTLAEDQPQEAETSNGQNVTKRPGKGRRALDMLKGAVKGGVTTALAADRAKALVGAPHAKERVGVVQSGDGGTAADGPVRFEARYKGKRGFAYVTPTALSWSQDGGAEPAWSVRVADMTGLRKVGGLAWPSRMVVGWSLHKQVVDGLVVETEGAEYHLTAVLIRDEIFNRLIAMGDQMWQLG
ncbi:hypothetical protein CCM_08302 [Cordyceps militaris CM01]|uniref:Uncharacterized protein n=1 Tax=Cordyceps militaris (strain CM01) TaxID=983644 RepID=G3JTB2_CORMM|nr:uncharacterized protein CCM_08302 [Cordyceps militaris CM01]EGX88259.1 hypothetical protein CCM_08302 [Cordyceps militaris CM01]